ncbi:peptide-methionine (S)-S-oxide reductase MsrA [Marinoscillum sp. MHG1-6]|uniref:peptide-methionine (S)-S-oxide reductase MsrA n=1 Tax=Marinoscillum sp. MHG1-6 TaxID=2959627 RepID=UPI0021588014|nr:peptide-methionine (S)-S-oxide reductase MsrA [Marinoscillum sp. MHG1-6]
MEKITLGSGCFWCTQAVFQRLRGVESAVSGYSGGKTKEPFYREVCSGTTGHAEVVQVTFNPEVISLTEVLQVFWKTHDPTTLNRQGNDVGTQYRSVVFYHNEDQKAIAEDIKNELDAAGIWPDSIVTEITAFEKFWPAEDYHQEYFESNGSQPYCQFVVAPKVEKFKKIFADRLK